MPKTKFQDIIFTLIMVIVMVYALVVYNISLDRGGLTNEVFGMAFGELVIMGIAAFLLEMFIAGTLAKKLAFRIVTPGEDRMMVLNFPMAFCWQMFIAGPLVRWIFRHLFPEKKVCSGNVTV